MKSRRKLVDMTAMPECYAWLRLIVRTLFKNGRLIMSGLRPILRILLRKRAPLNRIYG